MPGLFRQVNNIPMSHPDPHQIKQGIKQTFDLVATGYETPAMRYFPFSADHMATSLKPRQGERILDVACGTGLVAIAIAQMLGANGRVQAIDISDRMLDKALQQINMAGLGNIDLHNMDAEQLEFKSRYFDAASCAFGLFFLPDMQKGVREIFRVLKPGGRFIFSTFTNQAFAPLAEQFREQIAQYGVTVPDTYWRLLSDEDSCLELLRQAGFADVQADARQMGYHLASELDWWEILYNSGYRAMLEQLAPEQLAEFRQQHLADLHHLKTDKGIWLDVGVMYTFGRRPQ